MKAAILVALGALALPAAAQADRTDPVPKELEKIGVDERLDTRVPVDLPFVDEAGRAVTLGTYLAAGKPVLLTLNYARCPMLCTLELNGLVLGLKDVAWTPGREFTAVTVSIDPKELPALAQAKKQAYLADYARPEAAAGWHFLTGRAASIEALAGAVGFRYAYDAATDQFAHPAVIFMLTPDGRVSRYLYGVRFEPATLKLGLLEASEGRIGSAWDRFVLSCFHYDASRGKYSLAAMKIMRAGGVVSILLLGAVIGGFWARERRRAQGGA